MSKIPSEQERNQETGPNSTWPTTPVSGGRPIAYQPKGGFSFQSYLLGFCTAIILVLAGAAGYFFFSRPNSVVTTAPGGEPTATPATTDTATNPASPAVDTAPTSPASPAGATPTPELTGGVAAPAPTTPVTTGSPLRLNLETIRNTNGVSMQVTGFSFGADNTMLADVTVINSSNRRIGLNFASGGEGKGIRLADNLNTIYAFVVPDDNKGLDLEAGASLKGQFAFRGPLVSGATSLTLTTNAGRASSSLNNRFGPKFEFKIPLQ
jgi:hypothetical protein